jgi:hypothetical protein
MVEALKRNELLSPAEERRFQDEVAKPLDELAGERLPRSAGAIRSLARQEGAEGDAARAGKQAQAVTRMAEDLKEVSRQLAGGGDFREILGRMELIIELQREVIQKTETMENRPKDEKGGEK